MGFYQKKIIKEFALSANKHSMTGFLAYGKPAVACLEGHPEDISIFIRHVRKTVFATVPKASRKMTLSLLEPTVNPRFATFDAVEFFSKGNHHRPDMLDSKQLDDFLREHQVPVEVRKGVGEPVRW